MSEREAVISLGAGVQSSTMLLMAIAGEIEPLPKVAVFADTQGEPGEVYSWLDYLRRTAGEVIPIVDHSAGDLKADCEAAAAGTSNRASNPPLYLVNQDGSHGFSIRKCTRDYKVRPVSKKLRELGFGPNRPVEQWIGMSRDEIERMKDSGVKWQRNRWPLIELGMDRRDCEKWLRENGHPQPPKSACYFCPYQSNDRWRRLRDESPETWQLAVEFDRTIRHLPGMNAAAAYVHAQRVPLDEVDLSTPEDRGQLSFAAECEGMCGV